MTICRYLPHLYSETGGFEKNHPTFQKVAKTIAKPKKPNYLHQCTILK